MKISNTSPYPKIIGAATISGVIAIGVYIFILDTASSNKENSEVASSNITQASGTIETVTANPTTQTPSTSSSTTTASSNSTNTSTTTSYGAGSTTNPTTPTTPSTPTNPTPTYKYNNNSYTKSATYDVTGQDLTWTLTATITIENDIVTNVTTSQPGTTGQSQTWYNRFASGILAAVKGKNIDSLNVSKVGGATYTSNGFNSVLSLVRTAARK